MQTNEVFAMKTFSDNAARTWTVQVNVDAIKRVRDLAQVNLLEVVDGNTQGVGLLGRLVSDPILLCDVIYALCKPEADAKSVSDVDFGRAMAGDAIDAATTALLEELVGFFPQGRRAVLAKALSKLRALETAALKAVDARLDSPELERRMEAELQRLGTWSGDAPASSASTPGDSH
jgi:hypothetical protein